MAAARVGGGVGAAVGVLLVAGGQHVGLGLSEAAAASVAVVGAAAYIGHGLGSIWADPGLIPWLRRGLHGRPKDED